MSLLTKTVTTPRAMAELCRNFYKDHLSASPNGAILLLEGDLGAGKTTFCHGFNQALGITETINSPTFNLLNEYIGERGRLYHYDLYRMRDPEEVVEAGFSELWESVYRGDPTGGDPERGDPTSGAIHAVEWWTRAGEYLPVGTQTYRVRISHGEPEQGPAANKERSEDDNEEEARIVEIERYERHE